MGRMANLGITDQTVIEPKKIVTLRLPVEVLLNRLTAVQSHVDRILRMLVQPLDGSNDAVPVGGVDDDARSCRIDVLNAVCPKYNLAPFLATLRYGFLKNCVFAYPTVRLKGEFLQGCMQGAHRHAINRTGFQDETAEAHIGLESVGTGDDAAMGSVVASKSLRRRDAL